MARRLTLSLYGLQANALDPPLNPSTMRLSALLCLQTTGVCKESFKCLFNFIIFLSKILLLFSRVFRDYISYFIDFYLHQQKFRACLVLFLNLYFQRIKTKIKMVFCSCCILNLNMHLVSFSVFYILKLKTVICVW